MNAIARNAMLHAGVPQCRQVLTPPDTSVTDLSEFIPDFIDALTRPLTAEDQASGTWTPPVPPRIAMTGTLDEVQTYFQGDLIGTFSGGPYAWMTDGGTIIPPTEERVARMLMGTSHSPDEVVPLSSIGKNKVVTVEKVAINAVMAGCKPEYLPAVLAMATASRGCCVGYSGDVSRGHMYVVSGPYGKEIGMNSGFAIMATGNPANTSLQRACSLMGVNLFGVQHGINNGERMANTYWGTTFAENSNTPWDTLNVHFGYDADESIIISFGGSLWGAPGVQVMGYNRYNLEEMQVGSPRTAVQAFLQVRNARTLLLSKDAADVWKNKWGMGSIQEIQDYLWENTFWEAWNWYTDYGFAYRNDWTRIMDNPEGTRQLNPEHLGLPDDTLIPMINKPADILVVVAGGTGPAWGFLGGDFEPISIDDWR